MNPLLKRFFDRTALALFRTVPIRAARHLLFLVQSRPDLSDRWGYHIRPIHYYEPLPDFRSITTEQINRRRTYPGIDFNWEKQLALVKELAKYHDEFSRIEFDFNNRFFKGVDAAVYYSLIRHLKPQRIIEVGGGYSTQIAVKALAVNGEGKLICIEPYPEDRLDNAKLQIELIAKRVEEIDLDFFSCLQTNDILFIDSSHTVKFGSDVCYEFLEILPGIARGVWVHVHDIFFPRDYPAEWLIKRRLAVNEQYLLEAFMSFNRNFEVALSNHWLSIDHAPPVSALWPPIINSVGKGSSFWFYRSL